MSKGIIDRYLGPVLSVLARSPITKPGLYQWCRTNVVIEADWLRPKKGTDVPKFQAHVDFAEVWLGASGLIARSEDEYLFATPEGIELLAEGQKITTRVLTRRFNAHPKILAGWTWDDYIK